MSMERTSSSSPGSTPPRRARGSCARAWRAASKKFAPKRSSIFRNARKSWPRGTSPARIVRTNRPGLGRNPRIVRTIREPAGWGRLGRYRGGAMDTARLSPLEPLARAFQRAVPEHPADDGLFGRRSIVWRVNRDRCFPLAGMRSLMLQALHPLAMAGVAQHSGWRQDPFGRLAATSSYLLTTTYGDTDPALAAAAWVRKIHTHVRGIDPETGLPYSAEDPSLLLWVHAGMVESIVTVVQRYGRMLDAADADRYVAEMVRFAEIVGVPKEDVPSTVASLRAYIESVDLRQATPAARDAIGVVLDQPDLHAELRDLWQDL